ncbi:DUF2244 domain-containing protein [Azospirillum doebereinerae]|uniref:DUF2244 domain-containing protein n=1 Tax=Azospirillum doebereinerae TaxID=92933 RepID=A0A3S0V753_9PROT|nr:DUF2244 domain-containing protein [Azospirillum doebereinerae]MCG5241960.1 DUF2244 domain-containing protein [Azospirillum doebereinerae]RUQ73713.1 DUF2244 domain-containing protein [Azospirillum doebereinerae]
MPSDEPKSDSASGASRVFFDAILHPHRSLGRGGFKVLMGVVVALNLAVAGVLVAYGAWPVAPFCGLDVLVLWLAFRVNYRAARSYERVRLTTADLTVQRVHWKAPERRWTFHPYWLRVSHDEAGEPGHPVTLSSHGQSVGVGAFLSPEERSAFARSLDDALRAWRRPPCPPAPAG